MVITPPGSAPSALIVQKTPQTAIRTRATNPIRPITVLKFNSEAFIYMVTGLCYKDDSLLRATRVPPKLRVVIRRKRRFG